MMENGHVIDRSLCVSCGKCAGVCYAEALTMCGKEMSVEDIMKQIRQDKAYYKNSGGGVTLSGGEVLCNLGFASELAEACHVEGINVAIESNISFPFEKIVGLLKKVDLVMCDIKLFDDEMHKKYTGVSNKNILENIDKIDALGIPFIVRTPLIPGVTDSIENVVAIANHIKGSKNLIRYELLNFNPLGEGKYKGLNRCNAFEDARPLKENYLEAIAKAVEKTGVEHKII